jgi:hypothetical protein
MAVSDELFGEVSLRIDRGAGLVEVWGATIPSASLWRQPTAKPDRFCAIGSRDGARLTLRVGGEECSIMPGRGGITRRSYRVDARVDGVVYRLVPDGSASSALRRDGRRIAEVIADHEGGVRAHWVTRRTATSGAGARARNDDRITPMDASVGYLLAAAYGTGAPRLLEVFVHGLGHVPLG